MRSAFPDRRPNNIRARHHYVNYDCAQFQYRGLSYPTGVVVFAFSNSNNVISVRLYVYTRRFFLFFFLIDRYYSNYISINNSRRRPCSVHTTWPEGRAKKKTESASSVYTPVCLFVPSTRNPNAPRWIKIPRTCYIEIDQTWKLFIFSSRQPISIIICLVPSRGSFVLPNSAGGRGRGGGGGGGARDGRARNGVCYWQITLPIESWVSRTFVFVSPTHVSRLPLPASLTCTSLPRLIFPARVTSGKKIFLS